MYIVYFQIVEQPIYIYLISIRYPALGTYSGGAMGTKTLPLEKYKKIRPPPLLDKYLNTPLPRMCNCTL